MKHTTEIYQCPFPNHSLFYVKRYLLFKNPKKSTAVYYSIINIIKEKVKESL